MADGKAESACPKFEGAQKIAPTAGTLLNLANCYEKTGRVASAWASFRDAITLARSASRNDLAEGAQKRAAALEPRLARLTITVSAVAPGIEVTRDGSLVPREAWSMAVPVDPGEHVIEAHAPGRKAMRLSVEAPAEGAVATVNVPELEAAPLAAEPAHESRETSSAPAPVASPDTADSNRGATQRWVGIGLGALGVVDLAVTGIIALHAGSLNSDSKAECRSDQPNLCTARGKELRDDARSSGNLATGGTILGAALVGAGVVVFLTAPHGHDRAPQSGSTSPQRPVIATGRGRVREASRARSGGDWMLVPGVGGVALKGSFE